MAIMQSPQRTNERKPKWLMLALLFATSFLPCIPHASAQLTVAGDGRPGPVKAQHLTAELVALAPTIAPGRTLEAGLVLTIEDKWHVYWKNAGDAGEPPHITWTLPKGITAGPMQFPAPSRLPLGPLMNYGYEDTASFPVQLSAAARLKPGPVHLEALVTWIVCSEQCIPGKAKLGLDLTVDPNAPANPPEIGALGDALHHIPLPLPATIHVSALLGKTTIALTARGVPADADGEFYPDPSNPPDAPQPIVNAADQIVTQLKDGGGVLVQMRRSDDLKSAPKTLNGVLTINDDLAYNISAPVTVGELPASATPKAGSSPKITAWTALGLALVGGIILNLLPCVFPVLFLKGLTLVQSTQKDRRGLRLHALVYTLGILVSFWIIAGVLLALRAGGSQAGWGYQLQSPTFLVVLASMLFFFSLSLAGMFDLGLTLTSAGGELAQQEGYAGSFFTGVLATVVATPCTAPLMGAAIGFALIQPAWIAIGIFTALGLGLALPYLALSFQPAWTRWLPRPGAWMEILKQITAIPLFATVVYLVWTYGQLFPRPGQGIDQVAFLLAALLVLAIAGWVLGRWPARWASGITATALVVLALGVPLYAARVGELPAKQAWQPYTPAALQTAHTAGKPVFIDFTAAWCLSCQFNERLVLHADDVRQKLNEGKVVLLKADWTQYDPTITRELAAIGRSGVPTYVIYPSGNDAVPDVLPELLTKTVVLDALKKDLKQ
jgi:thiol:disulfide interchange protein/DsbC/DsbD-like thiol-disulfide interchange protein